MGDYLGMTMDGFLAYCAVALVVAWGCFGLWLVLTERGVRWGVRHFGNAAEKAELAELECQEETNRRTGRADTIQNRI